MYYIDKALSHLSKLPAHLSNHRVATCFLALGFAFLSYACYQIKENVISLKKVISPKKRISPMHQNDVDRALILGLGCAALGISGLIER